MENVKLGNKAEGSIVKLNESGKLVEFYIAKQNYESGLNGTGRVLVVRKDCYDVRRWWSNVQGHNNQYANSEADTWLNGDYKKMLDSAIQEVMGTTKIYYTPGNGNVTRTTMQRAAFFLSATELGHSHSYLNKEGTALPIAQTLQKAYLNGAASDQLTRSPHTYTGNSLIWIVSSGGAFVSSGIAATYLGGSRPAFTLPASLYVSDDGTVYTNTAPSAPGSITIPWQINGGSTITVEWGTASDAEANLEGYKVERSTDGGSTWAQIYQGGATSTTNLVPFGTESVMYRVKAYDSEGLESGWKSSGQVTVINNTAPTVPGFLTVPEAVQGGQPLAIAWGASSDGENNLSGYALERQVDGGAWAGVYSGPELSFTDQITKGWQTVAYRVRAYDTASAYSGFAVSATRTVNNNTPPAILCDHPANASLGVKAEGFAVGYTVEDAEGDNVTVTEAVDSAGWRTFSVQLGAANSFQLTGLDFMKLLNGRHTLSLTASDGASSAVHSLSFTKEVTAASVTLAQPMEADGPITVCVLSVSGSIPVSAQFSVKVTNNANDAAPVWEDCTADVRSGVNHIFANQTAVNGFAFNFKVEVERGPSGQGGYITSVQGGFQ